MGFTQQDFDNSQKRKFEKWKNGQLQSVDKKAFDDYINSIQTDNKSTFIVKKTAEQSYNNWMQWAEPNKKLLYSWINPELKEADIKVDDYVIIVGTISDVDRMGTNIAVYGKVKSVSSTNFVYDGYGYTIGIDTYSRDKIDQLIQQHGGGTPAGVGTGEFTLASSYTNQPNSTIYGKYGVNLIDYRLLSRDPFIGVNGKTLYNYGKTNYDKRSNTLYYAGGKHGISGIKWNKASTYDFACTKKTDDHGHLKIEAFLMDKSTPDKWVQQLLIDRLSNEVASQKVVLGKQEELGFFKIGLASALLDGSKGHYEVDFQWWYGEIKPKGIRRDFEFEKVNNIDLLSNCTQDESSQPWALRDEYVKGTLYDKVTKKLGVLNLDQAKVHKAVDISVVPKAHQNYFLVEMPEDALKPIQSGGGLQDEIKGIVDKCLTNNLSEITPAQEILAQDSNKVFFAKDLVKWRVPHPDHPSGKEVWCFEIFCNMEHIEHWKDILSETQIIYPLKEQKTINLPYGGFTVTMNNGTIIRSCNYTQIDKSVNEDAYVFKTSQTGYADIKIKKSNISSVTNVNGSVNYDLDDLFKDPESEIQTIPEKEE